MQRLTKEIKASADAGRQAISKYIHTHTHTHIYQVVICTMKKNRAVQGADDRWGKVVRITGGDLPFYSPFQGLLMWNAWQLTTTQAAWNINTMCASAGGGLKTHISTWGGGPTTSQQWRWSGITPQAGNGKRSCISYRNESNSLDSDSQLCLSFFFQRSKNYAKLRSKEKLH